ncbi:MAG: phosphoribosylamine--glycine ligase [Bacteroidia bacterium]
MQRNILIIGGGGREHALAWKIAQSPRCGQLYVAPGNAGTASCATNVPIDPADLAAVHAFVVAQGIDLVVIGPEQPLVDGMADYLGARGIAVVGPRQAAARLEGSKDFSKAFMQRHGIPTARYASFHSGQEAEALAYVAAHPLPVVVKASGLAAGKGVLICEDHASAAAAVQEMLSGAAFGAAGQTVVIEACLTGIEISVFVLTDGVHYRLLPSAKDYKRIGEGDIGPNTGGMGAVSPVPFADEAFMARVEREVVQPTLAGLAAEGIPYQGFLFIGLMVQEGTPYVLEYNVRLGDPETEVVLPRLRSDLVDLCLGVTAGDLDTRPFEVDPRACATLVLASEGYPGAYAKGRPIGGLDTASEALVFHAGTRLREDGQVVTSGGRVLAVSAYGEDLHEALAQARARAAQIHFEGCYYRRDIGQDVLR